MEGSTLSGTMEAFMLLQRNEQVDALGRDGCFDLLRRDGAIYPLDGSIVPEEGVKVSNNDGIDPLKIMEASTLFGRDGGVNLLRSTGGMIHPLRGHGGGHLVT